MSQALELTIFNKLFAAVAEEMGIVLRKSAFSPNITERRAAGGGERSDTSRQGAKKYFCVLA